MNIHGMLSGSRVLATVGFPTCDVEVARASTRKLFDRHGMAFIRNSPLYSEFIGHTMMMARSPLPPKDIWEATALCSLRKLSFPTTKSTWKSRRKPAQSYVLRSRELCTTADWVLERRSPSMNRLTRCARLIYFSALTFSDGLTYL